MIITREWIDTVAPTHGRTSCADDNLCNAHGGWTGKFNEDTGHKVINHPRCSRCYLLENEGSDTGNLEFEPLVSVSLVYRNPEPAFKVGDCGIVNGIPVIYTKDGWRSRT